ncbi:hypothetical protein OROMI_026454 [Orobanche minor]
MKMKAIDVLLEDIYVTKANECEKCQLLVEMVKIIKSSWIIVG